MHQGWWCRNLQEWVAVLGRQTDQLALQDVVQRDAQASMQQDKAEQHNRQHVYFTSPPVETIVQNWYMQHKR